MDAVDPARLVVMEHVYVYGRADSRPFIEDRTCDGHTHKVRVRAAMARDLMAAHDAARPGHRRARSSRSSTRPPGPRSG
jgi:hypothetical protein